MERFKGTILIDEAYIDYANNAESLIFMAEENERLIVLRSFSKGWFLSGVRVGFMVTRKFEKEFRLYAIPPHSIATPSARFVQEMLQDKILLKAFEQVRSEIRNTRDWFIAECRSVENTYVLKSEANFVTILFYDKESANVAINATKEVINANPISGPLSGIRYWISNKSEATKMLRIINDNFK